jgi:asparagine synthase (glutamine-hydrolysing)
MCGICGTVGLADEHALRWMTDVMSHRGPDGEGHRTFPGALPAGLGHRRLTIIDPSPAGSQPMEADGRYWITYNGELYNFKQIRSDLEQRGHRFKSNCDTEVVLRLFVDRGPAMLDVMNGIFAFGIWDTVESRLFLARDRLGVKPLYHTQRNGVFGFASELKALLPLVGRPTLDPAGLLDYLTFLWVPDPKTAFAEIDQLSAGHYAWYGRDGLSIHRYWDLEYAPEHRTQAEWTDLVGRTVTESVQRQMVADVPLGTFLSGGVDSSAVLAAMAETGRVSTYTIGFADEDLKHEIVPDDLRYARRVAALFETDYHERTLTADALELVPKAVWHLEEPVADPAAISTYLICREAGAEMPVMLSGVGADEIFAGYPRHLAWSISRRLDALPDALLQRAEAVARRTARPGRPGRLRGPRRNLWKYMRASGLAPVERYLSFSTYYDPAELAGVLAPDVAAELATHDPWAVHRGHLARHGNADELTRLLYLDAKTFLPNLNLTYTDKMGMAASVEVRVPLLDDELVALAARIPSGLKLHGVRRKYVFKRSQEGVLPRDIVWRRKAGFGAPIRSWLERGLAPLVSDVLSEETLRSRGLIDPAAARGLWDDNVAGRADNSLRIYAILCLELWCRTFLDQTWSFDRAVSPP